MPWLELLVPALVLLLATPSVTLAYLYSRSSPESWCDSLFGFLSAAAGVSLLTAVGIFLRASGLVETSALYFTVWNLSFLVLALAAYFAIRTALSAVGSTTRGRFNAAFAVETGVAYLVALVIAVRGKHDLFFPYIGGTYAATSLYLFLNLGAALAIVLGGRARLTGENQATLRRFLLLFVPLGLVFLADELLRGLTSLRLPWLPLLPLAPLTLYLFVLYELVARLRPAQTAAPDGSGQASCEALALSIARNCAASPLTQREREVLIQLLCGKSNAVIAHVLEISPNTVKNHIYSIFQKTGAGSRSELFLFAARASHTEADPERGAPLR